MSTSTNPKQGRVARFVSQSFKRKPHADEEEVSIHQEPDLAARQSANEPILPAPPHTNPFIWLCAIGCSIFAILVILTGLIVLIGFLIFHPRLPSFTVKSATLNSLQLNTALVLSSDTTVLLHIHNPNAKVAVDYESVRFELQFERHSISNLTFQPFSQLPKNTTEWMFNMAAKSVQLQVSEGESVSYSIQNNNIVFDFVGKVRTKAKFKSITSIRYWLHIRCHLEFNPPPLGNRTLVSSDCSSWK